MIIGQVVRLDVLAKRIINCSIVHTTVALLKNRSRIFFLTCSISSDASIEERNTFSQIEIGRIVGVDGTAHQSNSLHIHSAVRNIKILEEETGHEVFEPITEKYTGISRTERNVKVEAILLVVKGVVKEKKGCLFCQDENKDIRRVFLTTGSHIIKRGDIILLRDVIIGVEEDGPVYTQPSSTVEVNPKVTHKQILEACQEIKHGEIEVRTAEEIGDVSEDRSIFLRGRIFGMSFDKNILTIANHLGGVSMKVSREVLSGLVEKIKQSERYSQLADVESQLVFHQVLLRADIIWMKGQPTIQNPSVMLYEEA